MTNPARMAHKIRNASARGLVAVVALLALAAAWALLPAAESTHAQEDTTVWSATLTVDAYTEGSGGVFGCHNTWSGLDPCSTNLTDDDFSYKGVTYTVVSLTVDTAVEDYLAIRFSPGVDPGTAFGALTLRVGDAVLPIADADTSEEASQAGWEIKNADLVGGEKVSLSLTAPTPDTTPTPTPEPTPTPTPASGDSASDGEGTDTTTTSPSGDSTPDPLAPTISGTAQVGQTLTASAQLPSGVSFTYQWLANDAEIAGETSKTYVVRVADVGKTIKVRVDFTDDEGYSKSLTSAPTAAVVVGGL